MSTQAAHFNTEKLGQWSDEGRFEVEKDRIVAYAAATNDDIPQHAEGVYAPPVFAVVPPFELLAPTMAEVIPPDFLMAVLHGEQDFRFHRPIEPGMTLVSRGATIGIQPRSSGTTTTVKAETRTDAGDLVCEQFMTAFVRGAVTGETLGEEPEGHSFREELRSTDPVAEVAQSFDKDQTYRYSPASGDPMPIHLDDDLAKAMGFPGVIIHGLCTMAFTSRAVIQTACPEDPARLKRLAVRFSKPAFPKQTITTRIWDGGESGGRARFVFETTADSGDLVIKDGLAEIAS